MVVNVQFPATAEASLESALFSLLSFSFDEVSTTTQGTKS
jgi:hypothetical protein